MRNKLTSALVAGVLLICGGLICLGQASADYGLGYKITVHKSAVYKIKAAPRAVAKTKNIAQLLTTGAGPGGFGSGGAGPFQGVGDVVSGASNYWGFRAYNAAYATGSNPAAVVCDTATFAVCTTINILANGKFDKATASGSSSCAVACVFKTFIDQVSGNNATCASAATCAAVNFNCINSNLTCAVFSGVSGSVDQPYVLTNIGTPSTGGATVIATYSRNNSSEIGGVLAGFGTAVLLNNPANTVSSQWSGGSVTATSTDNVVHSIASVVNGASPASYIAVDGTITTGSVTYGNLNLNVIGDTGSTTGFGLSGNFGELALYLGTNFTTTQAGSMHTNQSGFWGTP